MLRTPAIALAVVACTLLFEATRTAATCPPAAGDFCPFETEDLPWSTASTSAWFQPVRGGMQLLRVTRPYWEHCDPELSEMGAVLRLCADDVAPCPTTAPPSQRSRFRRGPSPPAPIDTSCPKQISAWEDPRFGWVLAGGVEYLQNLLDTHPDPDGPTTGTAARDLMECAGKASRFPRLVGTRGAVFSDVHPWSLDCPASGPFDAESDCAFASRISLTGITASRNNKWPPVRPSATCTQAASRRNESK